MRSSWLLLAVVLGFTDTALAQHRVLVKFKATPAVSRAVLAYTPASVGEPQVAGKSESPFTGLQRVDEALRAGRVESKRAVFPRNAQARLRTRLPASKQAALPALFTLTEFQFPESANLESILLRLNALPEVVYAEPRQEYYATIPSRLNTGAQPPGIALPVEAGFPNDPRFPTLYAQHNTGQTGGTPDADVDAPEAWGIQTGSRDVVVAVLDSGIDYMHPDIAPNIWTNPGEIPGNGIDDDANGYVDDVHGYDFFHGDSDPMDDNGHGTHVSGTIGAKGNNGIGVTGMAWDVQLIAVKFLGPSGSGSASIEAVTYALVTGAPISNNSWGGGGESEAMADLMAMTETAGHLFLAAAGNDGVDEAHFPASYAQAMAVASTTHHDMVSGFSNFGSWVEISAPGSAILSTMPGNTYGQLSGTSMATPQVAGVAALLKAEHPNWTAAQIRTRLKDTTDPIDDLNPSYAGLLGAGRLNAHAAVLPATPRIELATLQIDDDQFGGSNGNLDGAVGPGETLELWIDLSNVGAQPTQGVTATLSSADVLVQSPEATYGDLPFLSTGISSQEPFRILVPEVTGLGTDVQLTLDVVDWVGATWSLPVTLPVTEPVSIEGMVTDIGTGLPIANARIDFGGSRTDFVLTEVDGTFRIGDLLAGDVVLTASADGYSDSDPMQITVLEDRTIDLALGAPVLDVSAPAATSLAWGTTGRVTLPVSNPGTDSLTVDFVELPAGATLPLEPVKVGVVRSTANRSGTRTWTALEQRFGPVPLEIDNASLNSSAVTLDLMEAAGIDVLFVGLPRIGSELTSVEIDAVRSFVEAGGGLVVSGALDTELADTQTGVLAELAGLEPAFVYTAESGASRFADGPAGGLGRGLTYPYASASQTRSAPETGDWPAALVQARSVLLSDDSRGLVATNGRRVFLSHPAENSSLTADRQLVYNAIVHAAYDAPWLDPGAGSLVIAAGEVADVELVFDAQPADPGQEVTATLAVPSNSAQVRLLSVALAVADGPRLNATAQATLMAGATSDILITVTNTGSGSSAPGAITLSTANALATISGTVQVPALAPGESATGIGQATVPADAPDGTPVLLDLSGASLDSASEVIRLVISRTSVVSGTVTASTGPVANEPVSWTGPEDGSTRTGSDGTFSADLPDGTYLIWAGGDLYAESGQRIVTVPPDTTGLSFRLARPGLALSSTELAADIAPWETATVATTLQSTGDSPVTFHADWVPAGLVSRLADVVLGAPPADPAVEGPETEWTWGRLLILQEEDPLGSGITEPLLEAHGVPFDIEPSSAMGLLDLSPYSKVLLPSNQPNAFAQGLETHRQWLEDWVEAGGVLQLHLAFNNNFNEIVGGIKRTQNINFGDPAISAPVHPTFTEPSLLDVDELAPLKPFGDGHFVQLPVEADTLLVNAESGRPVAVEFPFGNGAIVATNQMVEDSRQYHENMLLYRLRRPGWARLSGDVSGRVEVGASTDVSVLLSGSVPGTTQEAWLRLRTTDATAPTVTVPLMLTTQDAPALEVVSVTVDDADGVLDAGEEVDLVLKIGNSGTVDATGVAVSVSSSDLTVLTPAVVLGTVAAGGSVETVVRVSTDAALADGTDARLMLAATGDNALSWTMEAGVVVRSDGDAPADGGDLTLVRAYGSGAVLQLTEPGDDGLEGTVASLEFAYGASPLSVFGDGTQVGSFAGSGGGLTRIVDLSGLPEGQTVFVAFRAVDDAGNPGGLSNSVEVTTAPVLDVSVTQVFSGADGLIGAGDILFLNLALSSADAAVYQGVSVQVDASSDPWLYVDDRLFRSFPVFVGEVGSGGSTVSVRAAMASAAPIGAEVTIPLVVLADDGLPLDRVSHVVTLDTEDTSAPTVQDTRFLAGFYALGEDVGFSANVYEPGPVALLEAVIEEDGVEVARADMTQGEDGRWVGSWTVDRQGEFLVAYEPVDAAGNAGRSEGGAYQGFSTEDFVSDARNLLVVDAVGARADADGLRVESAMAGAGLSVDTWRTSVRGRDLPTDVLSAYDGSVVYVVPQGSFSTIGNFGAEETRLSLGGHLAVGGSVMLAGGNGLFGAPPADWLAEWFGVAEGGSASGTADGVSGDVVGDGLSVSAVSGLEMSGAVPVFELGDGTVVGARMDSGVFRSVALGARVSAMDSVAAGQVVSRAVTWMSGDPSDRVPPAAVVTLDADLEGGEVVLTWEATGDDGRVGRAMGYELRYAPEPPGGDWDGWWSSATPVVLGRPMDAGGAERVVVAGLDVAANWFFLLRAEDDGRNLSPFSNLARVAEGHPTTVESEELPVELELNGVYPNPVAGGFAFAAFALPEPGRVRLEVFDVLGRRVAVVLDESRGAGRFEERLAVGALASGVYVLRLAGAGEERVVSLVVAR